MLSYPIPTFDPCLEHSRARRSRAARQLSSRARIRGSARGYAAGAAYLAAIDGIGVEDLFYDELTPQPPADVAYRTAILESYLASGGGTRLVLSVDYVWDEVVPGGDANVDRYNDYQALALSGGYVPYAAISDRDLDEILTVDAGGGFLLPQPKPNVIFADSFESGDTSSWSQATTP